MSITLTRKQIDIVDKLTLGGTKEGEWFIELYNLSRGRPTNGEVRGLAKLLSRANLGQWEVKRARGTGEVKVLLPEEAGEIPENAKRFHVTAAHKLSLTRLVASSVTTLAFWEKEKESQKATARVAEPFRPGPQKAATLTPIPVRLGSLEFLKLPSLGASPKRGNWASPETSFVYVEGHYRGD